MYLFRVLGLCLILTSVPWGAPSAGSGDLPTLSPQLFRHLTWREIGPAAFGGRIDDVEAVPGNPGVIFVGAASSGIFKTTNHGVTWKAVFDKTGSSLSIGDLAIAPSDPNIVWAGTGEPNNRQSSSWGNGVYRSLDGGETWAYMGLKETHHIGRIVINPHNPDIVFVAALGHLWGPNEERGLYRSRDGGKSWEKALYISPDTGVVDVAMEENGRILYAAAYQRRRRAWGFVGGGPQGGIYRSLDGGDHWEKLTQGLPQGDIGRIGISISGTRPHIVYATIEHKKEGGVYRSDDRGRSWVQANELNPRPMYYSQIRVDPQNPHKVWVLGSSLYVSIDGGKTFTSKGTAEKIHVDHHALWINPNHPDHLLLGNDGGLYFSYDGARSWDFIDNLSLAQYYAIAIDDRDPYWIYGGTQDNGTWGIPSRTYSRLGIMNADVVNIAYGDGFYAAIDPRDHTVIYAESQNGRLYFVDLETREEKGIRPVPRDAKEEYRFNWNSPLILSPHHPDVLYYGGNKLFQTTDRGMTWQEISPDLTRNQEWKKLPIMGVERNENTLSRDDGVAHYGTITTISESRLQAGLIYVGSDDGYLQLTRDGGATWKNLTERLSLPGPRWVSRVLTSQHHAGTAYAAFDGHRDDDFAPYVFKTSDFGESWVPISGGLPQGTVVKSLAEHPGNPNLLFAGTEFGLFISLDAGNRWLPAGHGLPRAPVDHIIVNARDNDLILGTHGRGIIILDDIAMLERLNAEVLASPVHLFPVRKAIQFYEQRALPAPGASKFSGPNPDYGALITYYLKDDPASPPKERAPAPSEETASGAEAAPEEKPKAPTVKIQIYDQSNRLVRELRGPDRQGINRINWDLRYPLSYREKEEEGWFGSEKGPWVLPGEYSVRLEARGKQLSESLRVEIDPRAPTSPADLQARLDAALAVGELQLSFSQAQKAITETEEELKRFQETVKKEEKLSEEVRKSLQEISKQLEDLKEAFKPDWQGLRFRIWDLAGQLQASSSRPTEAQLRLLERYKEELTQKIEKLNKFLTEAWPGLLEQLREAGLSPPRPKAIALPQGK